MNIAIITASDLDMSSQYLPHIDSIGAALLTSYDFIKLLSLSVFGHIDFVKTSEVIRDAVQDECLSLSSPSVVFSIIDKVVSDYFIDTNSILFVLYMYGVPIYIIDAEAINVASDSEAIDTIKHSELLLDLLGSDDLTIYCTRIDIHRMIDSTIWPFMYSCRQSELKIKYEII